MVEDLCQSRAFWDGDIDDRLRILLLFFPLCLPFNILRGTVVEIMLAVLFDDLLIALCMSCADFIGELPDLFLIFVTLDPILALLKLRALLFKLDNLRVGRQVRLHFVGYYVCGSSRVARETYVCEELK